MGTKETEHNAVIKQLVELLTKENAHAGFDDAVKNISFEILGKKLDNLPYSIWQLTEHIRIAQWDILEFSRNENHTSPKWPDEYWPKEKAPVNEAAWKKSLAQIKADRDAFANLLKEDTNDITKPFSYGNGQNLLREALLIADHTSYHTGEIIIIRRLLGNWNKS